jgi:hypothetical protein
MGTLEHAKKMRWMEDSEIEELIKIDKINEAVVKHNGILPPVINTQALNWMAHYYSNACERVGKNKAMRDEYFAQILHESPEIAISRAEAIAKGSEFGMKAKYYENIAAGYLEVINGFKKTQEFHSQSAKNQV